ncbi:uncharacterized protein EI90DRAFT_2080986 [Cantharellus anzutake]|uniref:uncharacterized protein n=1 Tax=Cantharellus anzutake TaxID=1750568 RepID=UPI001908CC10|nr:uncharacterized protein EI90DRAFT_2080986 [Cantharellus anzutake]KAF8340556.1 hypothetical protein EI90DRAFT_2080986 [Cantharellus anzutake]
MASARLSSSLQTKLSKIFESSSDSYTNKNGERVISSRSILPILDALAYEYGDVIVEPGQEENFARTIESYPPLDLTPALMIQLVEQLSGVKLPSSPNHQEVAGVASTVLDSRQRSGPVASPAPSAWNRKPQRLRGLSETNIIVLTGEDGRATPTGPRSASWTLSSPNSPTELSPRLWPVNRPPSVAGSQSQSPDAALLEQSFLATPIKSPDWSLAALSPDDDYPYQPLAAPSFSSSSSSSNQDLGTFPTHYQDDDDLADDEEDSEDETTIHRHQRKHTLSSISSPSITQTAQQREEELQRRNDELAKKLHDTNREYENKLSDHEAEIQELQDRIEELKNELQTSKREEKELRLKARTSSSQLATLEAEMAKLQRQLDASRNSHQSLQKQYQEQIGTLSLRTCRQFKLIIFIDSALSENYRDTIRKKDQEVKHAEELATVHQNDLTKWRNERELAEANIESLKAELAAAQSAHQSLEEQKQANQMLRETIDRLRLDLDEIRISNTAGGGKDSAKSTAINQRGHASKRSVASLAAELRDRFDLKDAAADGVEVQELDSGDDDDEFVETIITTSRKRVGLRRNQHLKPVEDAKEFADASAQHCSDEFTSSISTQTQAPLTRSLASTGAQTSPNLPRSLLFPSASSDVDDDDADSSSSTLTATPPSPSPMKSRLPPTQINPGELPPSYANLEAEERELIGREYLRKFHPGINSDKVIGSLVSSSSSPMPSQEASLPVSQRAVQQWMKFKVETGRQCDAIDQILLRGQNISEDLQASLMTMTPRKAREWANKVKAAAEEEENRVAEESKSKPRATQRSPRGRFYKLYPSLFYPNNEDGEPRHAERNVFLAGMGFAAMMMMALSIIPAMRQEYNDAMYSDRQLWTSYNTLGQVSVYDGFFNGPSAGGQSASNAVWTLAGHAIQGGINAMRRAPPS